MGFNAPKLHSRLWAKPLHSRATTPFATSLSCAPMFPDSSLTPVPLPQFLLPRFPFLVVSLPRFAVPDFSLIACSHLYASVTSLSLAKTRRWDYASSTCCIVSLFYQCCCISPTFAALLCFSMLLLYCAKFFLDVLGGNHQPLFHNAFMHDLCPLRV